MIVIEHYQAVMAHDGGIVFQGAPVDLVAARSTLTGEHIATYVSAGLNRAWIGANGSGTVVWKWSRIKEACLAYSAPGVGDGAGPLCWSRGIRLSRVQPAGENGTALSTKVTDGSQPHPNQH